MYVKSSNLMILIMMSLFIISNKIFMKIWYQIEDNKYDIIDDLINEWSIVIW